MYLHSLCREEYMKTICFTIVSVIGLCISIIPLFQKSDDEDVFDRAVASSILIASVIFMLFIFGAFIYAA